MVLTISNVVLVCEGVLVQVDYNTTLFLSALLGYIHMNRTTSGILMGHMVSLLPKSANAHLFLFAPAVKMSGAKCTPGLEYQAYLLSLLVLDLAFTRMI